MGEFKTRSLGVFKATPVVFRRKTTFTASWNWRYCVTCLLTNPAQRAQVMVLMPVAITTTCTEEAKGFPAFSCFTGICFLLSFEESTGKCKIGPRTYLLLLAVVSAVAEMQNYWELALTGDMWQVLVLILRWHGPMDLLEQLLLPKSLMSIKKK